MPPTIIDVGKWVPYRAMTFAATSLAELRFLTALRKSDASAGMVWLPA